MSISVLVQTKGKYLLSL